MTINKFAEAVCKLEGKKKQISIAQVKEILSVVNELTGGALYQIVRAL